MPDATANAPGMRRLPLYLAAAVVAALLSAVPAAASGPAGDATVIAVIDSGFSPYHQDFLAGNAPPEVRALPLTRSPDTWLPGFPRRSTFAEFAPLRLTLDGSDGTSMQSLYERDREQWAGVRSSGSDGIRYRWIPGTKVIGALTFGPEPTDKAVDRTVFNRTGNIYGQGGAEHGMGTSSVAVGNLHGTCPSCLLVFLQYTTQASAERALAWAHRQPWIDAISNSYGFSAGVVVRDRVYNGTDVAVERAAAERGQTTFFSAGNGLENAFTVPNSTLTSSQEGPDWVVTVGAINPRGRDYPGTGKPADVAGIGTGYPSAYNATTVSNGKTFSGTSNATPQVAGTYAAALSRIRRALPGASRVQARGRVAGTVTAAALRQALFLAAQPTTGGFTDGPTGTAAVPAPADSRMAAEGYGAFRGALDPSGGAAADVARVTGITLGTRRAAARPAGEREWFVVDSWCRQHLWGAWSGGAWRKGQAVPAPDPAAPLRSAITVACPALMPGPTPQY